MSGVALEVLGRVPQTQHVWDTAEPTSKVARSMKGRVAKLERATAALCSGRHPRSFPRQNLVWDSNEQTSDRLNRLRHHGGEHSLGLRGVLLAEGSGDLLVEPLRAQERGGPGLAEVAAAAALTRGVTSRGNSASAGGNSGTSTNSMPSSVTGGMDVGLPEYMNKATRQAKADSRAARKADKARQNKAIVKGMITAVSVIK
jgi:hypothetical protein